MNYFLQLFFSILFIFASLAFSLFLWDIDESWQWRAFLVTIPAAFGFLLFKLLEVFVKIKRQKKVIEVFKIFSSRTFNLHELNSWNERHIAYRAYNREIQINFPNQNLRIIDNLEPKKYRDLFHYLRTHFNERRV